MESMDLWADDDVKHRDSEVEEESKHNPEDLNKINKIKELKAKLEAKQIEINEQKEILSSLKKQQDTKEPSESQNESSELTEE